MISLLNLLLFTAAFGSVAWCLGVSFERLPQKEAGFTAISVFGVLFILLQGICLFFFPLEENPFAPAGSVLYLLSLWLFWWAVKVSARQPLEMAYAEDEPDYLVTCGPYRYIRHPFYTAHILAWLAGVFASGYAFLFSTAGIMFLLYLREAIREEKRFERSALGALFIRYKARSGRFVPRLSLLVRRPPGPSNADGPGAHSLAA